MIVFLLPIEKKIHQRLSGFCREEIQRSIPDTDGWKVDSLFQDVDISCLDQPFYFLGQGTQACAFESKDKKYVLKFLKLRKIPSLYSIKLLSKLPFLQKTYLRKLLQLKERIRRKRKSYQIACEEFADESGLVFARLQKKYPLRKYVILIDRIGIPHRVCLDPVVCLVQKKASLVYPGLTEIIQTKGEKEAQIVLDNLIKFFIQRGEKGILDLDSRIYRNLGLIGSEVMQIDLGQLRRDSNQKNPKAVCQEIQETIAPLQE